MFATVSLQLDLRRQKANGCYPVKIRVYHPAIQKKKLYPTGIDLTEGQFHSIWESKKPRKEHQDLRIQLKKIENKAIRDAEATVPFSFEAFERRLARKVGDGQDMAYHYKQTIQRLEQQGKIGTASSYESSLQSLLNYQEQKSHSTNSLSLLQITPQWLQGYEDYMLHTLKRSRATVGIYLRPLRAIFNTAIAQQEIPAEYYPFGRSSDKYTIPATRGVKKALEKSELKTLFHAQPASPEQEKARDFFFFSYSCNGMNVKDIALLRFKDIQGNSLTFYRAKTIHTAKHALKPVQVHLTDFALQVIQKYGNAYQHPDAYVFPIIGPKDTPAEQRRHIQNFTRFVNQHLKKLAVAVKLPEDISTYYARHSFATNAIQEGASMEMVMEALSHADMKTTKNYFAGFEVESKRDLSNRLMDF